MLINFTNNYQFTSRIQLQGQSIEIVDKIKILGVTVTNQLDWSENTAILVKKVNQRMQLLRAVWGFGYSISEMVHLWKLFCLSVLEQSCVVWGSSLTQENKEDLERTQKSFAKLVLRDNYKDYEGALLQLNLEKLTDRRQRLMLKICNGRNWKWTFEWIFQIKKNNTPNGRKTSRDREKLPWEISSVFVKIWVFEFCHNLSFWALSQFEFSSSVTILFFEFCKNLNFPDNPNRFQVSCKIFT